MQAQIVREDDVIVVELAGRVDVESVSVFRKACLRFLVEKPVIFDFHSLSFVGSSGLLPFLETLHELTVVNSCGFKFIRVGAEFQKLFSVTSLRMIEIWPDEEQARFAFKNGTQAGARTAGEAVALQEDGAELLDLRSIPADLPDGDEISDFEDGDLI